MDEEELVQRIRAKLESHGIDPESIYPISVDFGSQELDPNEPVEVTIGFSPINGSIESSEDDQT